MGIRKYLTQHPVTRGTTMAIKVVAAVLSAGAAAVSIISFARSHGWIEDTASPAIAVEAMPAAVWLGVWPETDTARALGDTIQLTAALKDVHGALIPGVSAAWSSDDPGIASVDQSGTVIANGPGVVNIVVAAGGRIARSRIAVQPKVAAIEVVFDSTFRIPEGEQRTASVRAVDARGHQLPGRDALWLVADSAIARVDSAGIVHARAPGRTILEARVESASARIEFEVTPVPGAATVVSGDHQRADAGGALPQPVIVQVISRSGRPLGGVPVRFATDAGAGSTTAQSGLTDAQGRARAAWTLGALPGPQRLSISVPSLDSALVLVAEADPLPANTRISLAAEPASAPAGDSLAAPVVIRVTDSLGTALTDLPVSWMALDGGRMSGLAVRTDSLGEARAVWHLGAKAGVQRGRLQVGNPKRLPVFTIKATATAGHASSAVVVSGGGQKGPVAAALSQPVTFRVLDRNGNRVPAAHITLHPEAGTVADSSIVTDSTGSAVFRWTLGHTAGEQKLSAKVDGVSGPLAIAATALPLPAARIEFAAAPATGSAGKTLARPVRVTVSDTYGNPVAGQQVSFATLDGQASPSKLSTDAQGRAVTSWTLGARLVPQSLVASLKGGKVKDTLAVRAVSAKAIATKPIATKPIATKPTVLH